MTTPATVSHRPVIAPHDKFEVLGVKLGMKIASVPDFTCRNALTPDSDRHCVKFTDERCNGKPTKLALLRYSSDRPPPGCFFEYLRLAAYLDGDAVKRTDRYDEPDPQPLTNIHLVATASEPSLVYRIEYTLQNDDLADDSKLYQALAKKFGRASVKKPPTSMQWTDGSTTANATCDGFSCLLVVEDKQLATAENTRARAHEDHVRRQDAPTPQL
ncbi:hypothetical protein BH11MYX2_BH11MYX2_12220 [soil metagenome]